MTPPPEPRQACRNCGEWLKPGESWYCADCETRWGYDDYKKRLAAKARPALAAERNAAWDAWKERKDSGRFREPQSKDYPYTEGSCPQCGGRERHLSGCWIERQDKSERSRGATLEA